MSTKPGRIVRASTVLAALVVAFAMSVRTAPATEATPTPVPTARETAAAVSEWPDLKRIELAIDRTLAYFESETVPIARPDVAMLAELLPAQFQPDALPASRERIAARADLKESYFQVYGRYFQGRSDFEFPRASVLAFLDGYRERIDARTAWSMFCRTYALPSDFLDVLGAEIGHGAYRLTHAALQIESVEANGCWRDAEELRGIKKRAIAAIADEIAAHFPDPRTDLFNESVAILYYLGAIDRVRPEFVNRVLETQRADGGWAVAEGRPEPDNHSTILALWALFEHRAGRVASRSRR